WVRNTSAGVTIEVEGRPDAVNEFEAALTRDAPPLARIDRVTADRLAPDGFTRFEIRESVPEPGAFQPISPDISICPDCLRELLDPADRRYLYPFINCTNCGPRFTIIKDIPYDRPQTTMAAFDMCPDCAREYRDPLNRRFHAQPVACAVCGPRVWLEFSDRWSVTGRQSAIRNSQIAIEAARGLLAQGKIAAVKGLGGFHLACDATNAEAVNELRRRKGRVDKPFALMMSDMVTVEHYCHVSPEERALLESRERPIVLLWKRDDALPPIAPSVAPGQRTLGVMLPYTPLHSLLFANYQLPISNRQSLPALVMTSGNYSEEPIVTRNDDALERLAPLADAFLLHDRDIHIRTDDSVMRVFQGAELPNRRSRGYAPFPVKLPFDVPPLVAVGGELKNTFCVARERYAFMSHHIGDMENLETLQSFEAGVAHFERLFRITPEIIAHDLHPDYLSTRFAIRNSQPATRIPVQHHHAHIAACLAENGHSGDRPVIGVAFDGTGYGTDGAIWGGEFLVANYSTFERAAHLAYVPLPGGDAGTRKPARVALSHLLTAGVSLDTDLPPVSALTAAERRVVERQVETGLNSPPTSSMGRLFDAVAAIIGLREVVNYEGQAAIELEAMAEGDETEEYGFGLTRVERPTGRLCTGGWSVEGAPLIRAVAGDFRAGVPAPIIAARFHNGVAAMIRDVCVLLREQQGLNEVALSGGVFQNVTLLGKTLAFLREAGFEVLIHRLVPPNDGGIALGQALIASCADRV
ncbi:MAG: carbamoyltransferase HypF, partial [Chloroflexi bacterium]|nr:carbamoyltransferase HypF [Chloroflexota bacterium]